MARVYLGADHRGYLLKEKVEVYLRERGFDVIDEGGEKLDPADDFTVFASRVVNAMLADGDKDVRGVLICGSGQGMVMAANRFKTIRAALGWSEKAASDSRNDEDSNVLALPADLLEAGNGWKKIVDAWFATPFAGAARFKRRIAQLDDL